MKYEQCEPKPEPQGQQAGVGAHWKKFQAKDAQNSSHRGIVSMLRAILNLTIGYLIRFEVAQLAATPLLPPVGSVVKIADVTFAGWGIVVSIFPTLFVAQVFGHKAAIGKDHRVAAHCLQLEMLSRPESIRRRQNQTGHGR